MHRKLMPDTDTYAIRPVNPSFSIDKMVATLAATLECEIRESGKIEIFVDIFLINLFQFSLLAKLAG